MTPPHETHLGSNAETYAQDFYAWCLATAALVREGHWDAIDQEALIEELESLGKSQYRELENRLDVLVMHLLKWQAQPQIRLTSPSWASTIREQRKQIGRLLRDNPSLRPQVPTILNDIYPEAREDAVQEMGTLGPLTPLPADLVRGGILQREVPEIGDLLRRSLLPLTCPWTAAQVLDKDFWPGENP
jgi:hypothetical protein